tara:strand:- start:470 stop:661 length:192 start_codon:yes stop_codon:yes gene_type:complete
MRAGKEKERCYWNHLINTSPMEFLIYSRDNDEDNLKKQGYWDTRIDSVVEITKEDFEKFDGHI